MLRVFHPCQFGFSSDDIRVDGSAMSGGTSLSGYEDVIRTDGGGIWRADFGDADFGDRDDAGRAETLAWRALNAGMQGGAVPVIVKFCDRLHQPVLDGHGSPPGAEATVVGVVNGQARGNRATVLDIRIVSQRPLIGGERFGYIGADGWGERVGDVYEVEDRGGGLTRITFQPPIRGGIAPGAALDFDNPGCRMRRTSPASNPLNMGTFSSASISFQEDMRPPVTP